jgi:hypothetical protein
MSRNLLCLMVIGAMAGVSWAMMVDVPVAALVADSDRIVIAEVEDVGQPRQMTLPIPGYPKPHEGWFVQYRVKVVEDIAPSPAEGEGEAKAGNEAEKKAEELVFLTPTAPPQQPGGLRPMLADGPAYASLKKGQRYLLMLQSMPKRDMLYLQPYPKRFRPDGDELVPRVRELADVEKWAWGKPEGGLQITIVIEAARPVPDATGHHVQTVVAIRNAGKTPLRVPIYMPDRQLDVLVIDKDGKAESYPKLYPGQRAKYAPFDLGCVLTLEPGQVMPIGIYGKDVAGLGLSVPTGTSAVQVKFKASRETDKAALPADGVVDAARKPQPLWTGEIKSAKAPLKQAQAGEGERTEPADAPADERPAPRTVPKVMPRRLDTQIRPLPLQLSPAQ